MFEFRRSCVTEARSGGSFQECNGSLRDTFVEVEAFITTTEELVEVLPEDLSQPEIPRTPVAFMEAPVAPIRANYQEVPVEGPAQTSTAT